jgi:hypothetical protein
MNSVLTLLFDTCYLLFVIDSQPKKGYIINGWDGAMRQARPAEPGSAYAGPGDFYLTTSRKSAIL